MKYKWYPLYLTQKHNPPVHKNKDFTSNSLVEGGPAVGGALGGQQAAVSVVSEQDVVLALNAQGLQPPAGAHAQPHHLIIRSHDPHRLPAGISPDPEGVTMAIRHGGQVFIVTVAEVVPVRDQSCFLTWVIINLNK